MSQKQTEPMSALDQYRAAFERLKNNVPVRLAMGTPVSQNNVAKEAGTDPSALKKSRFPLLIDEIQRYVVSQADSKPVSARQKSLSSRKKNRSLQERLDEVAKQRDNLASLLTAADTEILELRGQLAELQRKLPSTNVIGIATKPSKD